MPRKTNPKKGPHLLYLSYLRDRISRPEEYPHNLPAFANLTRLDFHPHVTFLVGENGSGKSTLLEAMAISLGLNPEGGSRSFRFSSHASHSNLNRSIRLGRSPGRIKDMYFLRAESFFNVATEIERLDEDPDGGKGPSIIGAYGGQSLHKQSHGESFFALFKRRFKNHGLYFLDEPEAALSPRRQLEFLILLDEYVKGGAQFVIATHSPIILGYPKARIFLLDDAGVHVTVYEATEHYRMTKGFLLPTKEYLEGLLEEGENRPDES